MEDIEDLTLDFDYCTISWVPRTSNIASHRLALFASKLINDIDWVSDFPSWLIEANRIDERVVAPFCN